MIQSFWWQVWVGVGGGLLDCRAVGSPGEVAVLVGVGVVFRLGCWFEAEVFFDEVDALADVLQMVFESQICLFAFVFLCGLHLL